MRLVAIVFFVFLTACTSKLTVKGSFPPPLIAPLPYSTSVYYHDEFKNYTYKEIGKDRDKWIIKSGKAQIEQFDNIFYSLFEEVNYLSQPPNDDKPIATDLVIIPSVYQFQYTMPRETKVKIYEVWLKYSIRVQDGTGKMIADWVMTSYGKTPSAFLQSDEEAMNQAVVMALRDAGINLALGFSNVPEIKRWIASQNINLKETNHSSALTAEEEPEI